MGIMNVCTEVPILEIESRYETNGEEMVILYSEPIQCRSGDYIIVYRYHNTDHGIEFASEALLLEYLGGRTARVVGRVPYK